MFVIFVISSPVNWSAQSGSHCTEPQVPISTIEASSEASSVDFSSGGLKISRSGWVRVPGIVTACRQRTDSGTSRRMPNVSKAGAAPTSATQRQESMVTWKNMPTTAMNAKPTLAAAPITPARSGRWRSGHTSITSATPSDHSPPMPSAAMNRVTARCQGSCAKKTSPVNTE